MKAKTTFVTLAVGNVTQDFEFTHAERILRMRNNGGWKLPADSKFEFVEHALRYRKSEKRDNGKQERRGAK